MGWIELTETGALQYQVWHVPHHLQTVLLQI